MVLYLTQLLKPVVMVGNAGTDVSVDSLTRNSANLLTATFTFANFTTANALHT